MSACSRGAFHSQRDWLTCLSKTSSRIGLGCGSCVCRLLSTWPCMCLLYIFQSSILHKALCTARMHHPACPGGVLTSWKMLQVELHFGSQWMCCASPFQCGSACRSGTLPLSGMRRCFPCFGAVSCQFPWKRKICFRQLRLEQIVLQAERFIDSI